MLHFEHVPGDYGLLFDPAMWMTLELHEELRRSDMGAQIAEFVFSMFFDALKELS